MSAMFCAQRRSVLRCNTFRLEDGPRWHRVEATERTLPIGPVAGLDQGQEPEQSGHDPGAGGGVVKRVGLAP
jgi:hypothetical protein